MYNNINRSIGLNYWKKGMIGVVISFEQEYTVFCNEKPNLGKKATEDKTTNFSKESEY